MSAIERASPLTDSRRPDISSIRRDVSFDVGDRNLLAKYQGQSVRSVL